MNILSRVKASGVEFTKALMLILTILMFMFIAYTLINQERQSNAEVAGHTQTLNEINNVVKKLEQNNQVNHDTTIKYLQCIVEGLITSTPNTAQASFNSCLVVSGVQESN